MDKQVVAEKEWKAYNEYWIFMTGHWMNKGKTISSSPGWIEDAEVEELL